MLTNLESHKNISLVIWYAYTLHNHTLTHTYTYPFAQSFSQFYNPAQCSKGALSLIAFPSPLIILMVFHATQWVSACLHHIKVTYSLQTGKWKHYIHFVSIWSPVGLLYMIKYSND